MAIVAYARARPAVRAASPALRVGPALRVMHLLANAELAAAPAIAARDAGTRHVAVPPLSPGR